MGDEIRLHRPQAVPTGSPPATPPGVDMEQVKSIIGAVDIGNVTQTGDLYLKTATRFDEHAANLVAHAEALAGIWRGKPADNALEAFAKLHGTATAISANTAEAGETYKWLGTTILPFYKDSAQSMTDGFIRTDGDDERARELLDRMNDRVAEANNGLPSQLVVTLPVVNIEIPDPGDGEGVPPTGQPSYGFPGKGNGAYGGSGSWNTHLDGEGPYGTGLYEGGPNGPNQPVPTGPNGPTVPGGPSGPGGPGVPGGLGGIGNGVIGNNTDLAGTGPNPGTGQNPFTLNPSGPTPSGPSTGLPGQPGGPSPYNGFGGFNGPGGNSTTRGPSSFGAPRIGLAQGPGGGVIGAGNGGSVPARGAAQQTAARGQAGMPIGGARGGGTGGEGEEHTRSTWLSEDEDVWGSDADVPPSVIG